MPTASRKRRWPQCPECARPLDPLRHGQFMVDRCRRCGGLWFDRGELKWILRDGDGAGATQLLLPRDGEAGARESSLGCVEDHGPMRHHALEGLGFGLARCEQCLGIWLTKGTLEQLETIRDGENALAAIEQPSTRGDWLFQLFSGLPVEFNMRPRRPPVVTWLLVVACGVAFMLEAMLGALGSEPAAEGGLALGPFALVPADFPGGRWWLGLLSHQFLHGGLLHLIGNMYLLYVLGDNVEDMLGSWRYLLFYLVCGAVGGLAQTLADAGGMVPMVGASGAIAGLAAAYTLLFRRAQITLMIYFWQCKVSVIWYWGLWVAFNVVGAGLGVFGVGWFAHLGGFAAGLGITALAWHGIQAANPVLEYLREGAPRAKRLRHVMRNRRRRRFHRGVRPLARPDST